MRLTRLFISGLLVIVSGFLGMTKAQDYNYSSPDGRLELIINTDNGLSWSLKFKGERIILPSSFEMEFATRTIPDPGYRIKSFDTEEVEVSHKPVVAHKNSVIEEKYNQVTLIFR